MRVEVPFEALSPQVLQELIESFVLREGTDYGAVEISLASKVRQIEAQIAKGDVKIVFDGETESVTLMTKADLLKSI